MKFLVCIKQVPDVSAPMQIQDGKLVQDTGRMVLDAYSASAVEGALVLAERLGGAVEVILIGPESARETLRKALAMGAGRGTHVVVDEEVNFDAGVYAELLAAALKTETFDAVLCGKQAQDTDAGLTGTMLAERLGLPYAANAVGLDVEDDKLVVTRQGDAGTEIIELPVPCLVTCSNDMNDPRIPNLKGIMQSKKKEVAVTGLAELGFGELPEARTATLAFEPLPEREPGRIIEGDEEEATSELVRLLIEEARVL